MIDQFNKMTISRFIYFSQLFIIWIILCTKSYKNEVISNRFLMPEEGDPHKATWMAYGATLDAWGTISFYGASRLIARKDLIRIAANLARFEHVKMLINEDDLDEAKLFLIEIRNETEHSHSGDKVLPLIEESNIEFIKQPVNDLWMRDTGPVFVFDDDKNVYGVNFNFNGWGQKDTGGIGWKKSLLKKSNGINDQNIDNDQEVADFIIQHTGVKRIDTWLVMEGGGIEVNGKGTAICTESCILNENRNPGRNKTEIEKELLRILGIRKVIWLPGLKGYDVTDGHVDFYVRFVTETKVLCSLEKDKNSPDYNITHQNQKILSMATDAEGNKITIIPLIRPNISKVETAVTLRNWWKPEKSFFNKYHFAAGYVGFYIANKCVLMTKFGDENADKAAFDTIRAIYPNRIIMQITTDGVANAGGTIHCATQQQISKSENGFNVLHNSAQLLFIFTLGPTILVYTLMY